MLHTILSTNNSQQLTNNEIAKLIFEDAISKMSQLSGYNRQQAFNELAAQELFPKKHKNTPIINEDEVNFIHELFH
ncbi:hypothetical protein [Colwellia echini]|uniref:Uncharacterized protein n=1 Tax=Colwellia echini TaxID=1982103 RepID=A0ABY3MXR5_9GAMM|nr:hypothetical protein [Colwellia echini]TYK65951.1 hypothetical protein CWS31_008370 [Colwellia echini]